MEYCKCAVQNGASVNLGCFDFFFASFLARSLVRFERFGAAFPVPTLHVHSASRRRVRRNEVVADAGAAGTSAAAKRKNESSTRHPSS